MEYVHDENCVHEHDHDHGHGHIHDENCAHDHGHTHVHGDDCGCEDCGGCAAPVQYGEVSVEWRMHDEAVVVSGALALISEYAIVRHSLELQLGVIAKTVSAAGGIIGHIKAAASSTEVEAFSITDVEVSVKKSPEQEVKINLAAIVFGVPPEDVADAVRQALTKVRDICK